MALSTFSKFYFGTEIELNSNKINFSEGGGPEITATIELGVYSLTGLAAEIEQELNAEGDETYTVTFNRDTRIFTISATGAFELLIDSGTNSSSGAWSVFGFTGGVDLTGGSSYSGASPAGSEYITQFPPQDYVAPGFNRQKGDASVNVSAAGVVEVIAFGDVDFIDMDLQFITDIPMDGKAIRNNPTGVQDAIDFLTFAIKRGPIEFMPDKDNSADFVQCTLERSRGSRNGTGYVLQEEVKKKLPGFYKTNKLSFRIVE